MRSEGLLTKQKRASRCAARFGGRLVLAVVTADKSPNTLGAAVLGLSGPGVADAGSIVAAALQGRIDVLWVFGHDLTKLVEEAKLEELSRKLRLFVFSGTNENPTVTWSHWVLPTAAYVEKDGTFVNCHGRIQRIGRVFPALPDSREDWTLLLEISRRLNHPLAGRAPHEIFLELAKAEAPFAGLSYEQIGCHGAPLVLPAGARSGLTDLSAEARSAKAEGGTKPAAGTAGS